MRPAASASRIRADTRLECRICWYVYDPAVGDEFEQIPPGTGFADLPDHWCCPQCDAGKDKFLPIGGELNQESGAVDNLVAACRNIE